MSARIRAFLSATAALAAIAVPAEAWQVKGPFTASVNGHVFDRIELASNGCSLGGGLFFDAPEPAYSDKNPVRNVYRFRARIRLSGGREVTTRLFRNREAGRRKYLFSHETSGEGCWATKPHEVQRVVVNGCRNRGCAVESFE